MINTLADLKAIVSEETWPEVKIAIFRARQYPIRGIANEELLVEALQQIPDHSDFTILAASDAPSRPRSMIAWGTSHDELRKELARLEGQHVLVGQDPFDLPETRFFDSPEEGIRREFLSASGTARFQEPRQLSSARFRPGAV